MQEITKSFHLYISQNIVNYGYAAGFDLDWTLIRPSKGTFPKIKNKYKYLNEIKPHNHGKLMIDYDVVILPGRLGKLLELQKLGYMIIIVTNQKVTRFSPLNSRISRINLVIKILEHYDIHPIVMMSTAEDVYRKPNTGMWDYIFTSNVINNSFYCGDAAGRTSDFSDSDAQFAKNANLTFYVPEQIFPE